MRPRASICIAAMSIYPLKLVHLAGPHGLDLILSAYYSSNVLQQFDTWNREAPDERARAGLVVSL